jgi:putative Holliday junction resolvase
VRNLPKLLGIDPGQRWVGLATTDETATITTPLETVDCRATNLSEHLKTVVRDHEVDRIIVGYPDPLKVDENERTRQVDDFIDEFVDPLPVPYETVSERYTTKRADELRKERDTPSEDQPDAEAAALILDQYLGATQRSDADGRSNAP